MPRPADMSCSAVRNRLDPFLDGDLTRTEQDRLSAHLEDCPACREELHLARDLRRALRDGLPTLQCPPEVTARVLAVAREESARAEGPPAATHEALGETLGETLGQRLRAWLAGGAGPGHLRPATTLAAVAALLLLLVAVPLALRNALSPDGPPGQTAPEVAAGNDPEYTAEEIAQAEHQARLVLAAVAQVGRGAGHAVRDEVFEEAIAQPARRVMESLQGGGSGAGGVHEPDRPSEADRSERRP